MKALTPLVFSCIALTGCAVVPAYGPPGAYAVVPAPVLVVRPYFGFSGHYGYYGYRGYSGYSGHRGHAGHGGHAGHSRGYRH